MVLTQQCWASCYKPVDTDNYFDIKFNFLRFIILELRVHLTGGVVANSYTRYIAGPLIASIHCSLGQL